jgi:hypothetical protein
MLNDITLTSPSTRDASGQGHENSLHVGAEVTVTGHVLHGVGQRKIWYGTVPTSSAIACSLQEISRALRCKAIMAHEILTSDPSGAIAAAFTTGW